MRRVDSMWEVIAEALIRVALLWVELLLESDLPQSYALSLYQDTGPHHDYMRAARKKVFAAQV